MNRIIQCTSYGAGVGDHGQTLDRNNCTVRALANALGKTTVNQYIDLEAEMREAGRVDGKGCGSAVWLPVYKRHGGVVRAIYGKTASARYWSVQYQDIPTKGGTTIGKILPKLTGNHIVVVRGHAFAVVNGGIIDNGGSLANTSVAMVIDFPSTVTATEVVAEAEQLIKTKSGKPSKLSQEHLAKLKKPKVKYTCSLLEGKSTDAGSWARWFKSNKPELYPTFKNYLTAE